MFTMMIFTKVLHNFVIVAVVRYLYRINIADESLRLLRYDPIEIESIHISQRYNHDCIATIKHKGFYKIIIPLIHPFIKPILNIFVVL